MREHDARRGSSGRFGISFCYGLASMFFGALCFDIGAHLIKRCATNTADIVEGRPGIMKNSPKIAYSSELKSEF